MSLPKTRHAADLEFRTLHQQIFRNWLSIPLAEQKRDFDACLPPQTHARAGLLRWLANNSERLIPPGAMKAERMLFRQDLSLLLCECDAGQYSEAICSDSNTEEERVRLARESV